MITQCYKRNYVSVLMPCFNVEQTIERSLRSIANQAYSEIEVVIVDDGSKDNSLKLIQNFQWPSNIHVNVISRNNRGFLPSLVEAFEASHGEFLARLDADDYWGPNHLSDLVAKLQEERNLVLVGSSAIKISADGGILGDYLVPLADHEIRKYMPNDNPFVHSSIVMKRESYQQAGGYQGARDESSQHISDYQLWFNLSKIGNCENLSVASVYYRVSCDSMSRSISTLENYRARLNMMREVYKYYRQNPLYSMWSRLKVLTKISYLRLTGGYH